MTMCFRAYDGKVAFWEKPPSGDPMAPFDDPLNNMQYVRFHSDLQYLANVLRGLGITVNHALVAGVTGTGYSVGAGSGSSGGSTPISNGQIVIADHVLYEHDLGYPPLAAVMYDDYLVSGITAVQEASNRVRFVSSWVDETNVYLREIGISSSSALGAVDRDYDVYVFKDTEADPAEPLLHVKMATPPRIVYGHGKISDETRPIRRTAPGDQELFLPVTRNIDIRNGGIRVMNPDDGWVDNGEYNGGLFNFGYVPVSY